MHFPGAELYWSELFERGGDMTHWSDSAPFSDRLKWLLKETANKQFWVLVEVSANKYHPPYQHVDKWVSNARFAALATELSLSKMARDKNIVSVELDPQMNLR